MSKLLNFIKKNTLLVVLGVVILLIGVFVIKTVFFGGGSDFYTTTENIFKNELGTFKYVLDVRTGAKGTVIKEVSSSDTSVDDLNNLAADDTEAQNAETEVDDYIDDMQPDQIDDADSSKNLVNWADSANVKTGNWEYPNYKITIEGCTTSLEPLTTKFDISIATEYWNDKFTEVTCFQDNYYIDIESMREWLVSSGDSYLIKIGEKLPQGSKYLTIPASDFTFASRYAEYNEKDLSNVTGLDTMYRRFLVSLNSVMNTVKSGVGSTGMESTKDTSSISLKGANALPILEAVKSIAVRQGDFYTSLIETSKNSGLYDDTQYKQAIREKDNVIDAFYDLATYLSITDLSSLNLGVEGTSRIYTNGSGNDTLESTIKVQFATEEKDFLIQFSGLRSGDVTDVKLPSGSKADVSNLGSMETLTSVLYSVLDYLNVSSIPFENQLELTPENISQEMLDDFIELVNDSGASAQYLTRDNIFDFIEVYANYEETNDSTKEDMACATLVSDFFKEINSLTGGVVKTEQVEQEVEVVQYPDLNYTSDGVEYSMRYNKDESDASIVVLDVDVINKSDKTVTIDTTNYSLRTLLSSVYPSNNDTMILNYDNTFNVSSLVKTFDLAPKSWNSFRLYFVISEDTGHMDLFYGDSQLGAVIEY